MSRQRKLPAGLVLRGRTYHANFRAHGRRVRKRLSSDFKAASELLNDLRARADRGDFGHVDNNYPWDDLKTEFLKWKRQTSRNPEDYERDLKHLEQYFKPQSVQQITHAFVYGYRDWRLAKIINKKTGRTTSARTVNRQVGTLRHMLAKGVEWGRIGENILKTVKPLEHEAKKIRRSLTVEEVQAIFEASAAHLLPVFRLFLTTGLRMSELVKLRFSDIDVAGRCVTVRAENAKSKKARTIPVDDQMLAMLTYLKERAPMRQPVAADTPEQTAQQLASFSREHVFVTQANTPWRNNLLTRFRATCKRAGIEGAERGGSIDLHSLRVTATTLMIENGASPKAVQAILGHSTLTMTMNVYAKATDQAKRNAVGVLPWAKVSAPEGIIPLQNGHKVATTNSEAMEVVA